MQKGQMLANAIKLMVEAHHGQFDKGGNPYLLHPLKVMHYLKDADEELQCIAVGHDVIEDTKTTYADLRAAGMSERVINGIRCLTKVPGETYEEYQAKVMSNPDSMRVKMADLRHNSDIRRLKAKHITEKDIARIAKYQTFYLMLEAALADLK